MMESLLRGLLIGALLGTSLGPVAFWAANVRKEGFSATLPMIIGGAVGDLLLAGIVLVIRRAYDGRLVAAAEGFVASLAGSPFEVIILVTLGGVLMGMQSNGGTTVRTNPRWRWLWAFLITLRPDTFAAVWVVIGMLGQSTDDVIVLLAGIYVGAFLMWSGSVEAIARLRSGVHGAQTRMVECRGFLRMFGWAIASLPPMTKCIGALCWVGGLFSSAAVY